MEHDKVLRQLQAELSTAKALFSVELTRRLQVEAQLRWTTLELDQAQEQLALGGLREPLPHECEATEELHFS